MDGGERFPQWSVEETRDLLMLRAELDPTFMEKKRNKVLWELISTNLKERGYNRTPDQCKCKWKNLVTRYKGFESMEQEAGMSWQQFPFYNELQAIFTGRMQRMEAQAGSSNSKKRLLLSSSDDDDQESDATADKTISKKKKKKKKKKKIGGNINNNNKDDAVINLKEILEELMKQHMQIEMQWMKLYESKQEKRRRRDMEWRQKMEALENDNIMFHRRRREREDQTRIKEETRSEKRDALITLLLNKLA